MSDKWIDLNAAILSTASVVGKKEREGPLGERFDLCDMTDRFGMKTWEEAESEMQRMALGTALGKVGLHDGDVGALFAGDLLNQCVGSAYGLLSFDIPYFGLYGACSTCAEGLLLASVMVSGGFYPLCGAVTSSHYCAAERQYRTPIEYGAQRPPTAQWTATAGGAFLLAGAGSGLGKIAVTGCMAGVPFDGGITDANNMGAAMAPAAADSILTYFRKTKEDPEEYDAIVTGDLGDEGSDILEQLLSVNGLSLGDRHKDCGRMIYDPTKQDVHAGGSGCGCSASMLSAHFLPMLERGEYKKILFFATGALMSPSSLLQGDPILGIAPLVRLEALGESSPGERS
jgi:stage V sporulation protein AD